MTSAPSSPISTPSSEEVNLVPRRIHDSVEELLADATYREPFVPDGVRSTAGFERVVIEGRPHIVKFQHADDDFAMRALGDLGSRTAVAFAAGLLDASAAFIDHTVVGVARGVGRNGWGCAVLMRDVSHELVSIDDSPFTPDQNDRFVDHLAAMCSATWGWRDDPGPGLVPYPLRWQLTGEAMVEVEASRPSSERVVPIIAEGLARFAERAPADVHRGVQELRADVTSLSAALSETPSCFLHGDWKASNMGTAQDGRTVLIDWVYVGEGPACHDLGWYLALNRQKLPVSKEQVIEDFRAALESHGVETTRWWDVQLALSLLGTVVQFGWEKALGDEAELGWWCDRAREGLAIL